MPPDPSIYPFNRRAFLSRSAGALGMLALAHLLDQDDRRGAARGASAAADVEKQTGAAFRIPRAKARSVICLFQHGGPSQMDLFDPKPALARWPKPPYPGKLEVHFDKQMGNVLASPFAFHRRGQSGLELSELLPHTGGIAGRITVGRSMTTESVDHESALRLIHSGKFQAGRPTLGSWVIYGLGTENQELPAYVVLTDPGGLPVDGVRNWSSGWLPAVYQGTPFRTGSAPVPNLASPGDVTPGARAGQLGLLDALNRSHLRRHPDASELEARIAN